MGDVLGLNEALMPASDMLIINEDVSVIEYLPEVFAYLRFTDNINNKILKKSLLPQNNIDSVFKAGHSQGKSASFFFFSKDQNFIIKTLTNSELHHFQKLAPAYVQHISRNNNSLLARIYGIFTVKMAEL